MIPEAAVEAAARAMYAAMYADPFENQQGEGRREFLTMARAALEAAAPHMPEQSRSEIQVEVLLHARAVITQSLSTAEKWRYDQVCANFQEMIDTAAAGELNRPTP